MARRLRHTPQGGSLFEVTCRTVQSRFLLRPGPLLNEIIVGALARAKRFYGVEISGLIFLSNHLHILIRVGDSEQLADRSLEFAARNRGESFGPRQYAFDEVLELDPLPCWRHLSPAQYQSRMAGLVDAIIAEAEARRKETGLQPLGPAAILAQHPFGQPMKTKRSLAPRAHAFSREVRKAMVRAYAEFVADFRQAAEKLRGGDRMARFPAGSFPPGLPFVRGGLSGSRG